MSVGQGLIGSDDGYIGTILWEMDIAHNYGEVFIPSSFHTNENESQATSAAAKGHITYPQLIDVRLPIPNDNQGQLISDNNMPAEWLKYGPEISPDFKKQFEQMSKNDQKNYQKYLQEYQEKLLTEEMNPFNKSILPQVEYMQYNQSEQGSAFKI